MDRIQTPTTPAAPPLDELITGYCIMRETEIAPAWWGAPTEVGETTSATVADRFCREQNAVTMDPNRAKRIQFYAEPITVDVPQILTTLAEQLLTTPNAHLGHLTITQAVLDIAGPAVTVTALRPVWETLPLGGHGDRGLTHTQYADLLLAAATDSDPDMDEVLRRARTGRQAVAA